MKLVSFIALAAAGCSSHPSPPPAAATPDASDAGGSICAAACARLDALGCPEAHPPVGDSCVNVCNHTETTKVFDLKPACIANAQTVDAVHACGTVVCAR